MNAKRKGRRSSADIERAICKIYWFDPRNGRNFDRLTYLVHAYACARAREIVDEAIEKHRNAEDVIPAGTMVVTKDTIRRGDEVSLQKGTLLNVQVRREDGRYDCRLADGSAPAAVYLLERDQIEPRITWGMPCLEDI